MNDKNRASGGIARRTLLAAGAALPLFAIRTRPADAAEFSYKLATGQDPTHPVNKRSQEAIDRIREATSGKLEIRLFPANQLGSDTDLLGQVRNGGVEFFNESSSILATLVPAAGLVNVGFAFSSDDQVYQALDGGLGKYIKSQIEQRGSAHRLALLGQRLPRDHLLDQADPDAGRPQGIQDPRPRLAHPDVAVSGARGGSHPDQLQRALLGPADQAGGGPGEPAADHRHRQAVRGAAGPAA